MNTLAMRGLRSVILLGAILIAGCGTFGQEHDETRDWSASKLYSEAHAELMGRNYAAAIKLYEKLEARYPYGRYAQQAQLEVAYAHFKEGDAALQSTTKVSPPQLIGMTETFMVKGCRLGRRRRFIGFGSGRGAFGFRMRLSVIWLLLFRRLRRLRIV